jgi:hypothetical protein
MPKAADPNGFYLLLCSSTDGRLLSAAADGGSCATTDRADDLACWHVLADVKASEAGSASIVVANAAAPALRLRCVFQPERPAAAGCEHRLACAVLREGGGEGALSGGGGYFELHRGPAERPSATLAHLEARGWALLPALIAPAQVREIRAAAELMLAGGAHAGRRDVINEAPAAARATVHPVLLHVLERYIGGRVHLGHTPTIARLAPGAGGPVGGWHSDYPFNGNARGSERAAGGKVTATPPCIFHL